MLASPRSPSSSGIEFNSAYPLIACIAIVGKEPLNDPLYIRTFCDGDQEQPLSSRLSFHYMVHSALDFVEEKGSAESGQAYLGALCPIEDFKVYGYVTNTSLKFFVVIFDDPRVRDADVRSLFRFIHDMYIQHASNPFSEPNAVIDCKGFDADVVKAQQSFDNLLRQRNRT